MADALETVLLDDDLRRRLDRRGRQDVLESFGADRMAREALKVYQTVALSTGA